jgi:UDP-glucose 4-epimerase
MKTLITGSSGHLGEALVRTLRSKNREVIGVDIVPSEFTDRVGSIVDRHFVKRCMEGVDAVMHTATLHKPHVVTHSRQSFVDTNITGTLNLLEEAVLSLVLTRLSSLVLPAPSAARLPRPLEALRLGSPRMLSPFPEISMA